MNFYSVIVTSKPSVDAVSRYKHGLLKRDDLGVRNGSFYCELSNVQYVHFINKFPSQCSSLFYKRIADLDKVLILSKFQCIDVSSLTRLRAICFLSRTGD
jgi:hypothetical protein